MKKIGIFVSAVAVIAGIVFMSSRGIAPAPAPAPAASPSGVSSPEAAPAPASAAPPPEETAAPAPEETPAPAVDLSPPPSEPPPSPEYIAEQFLSAVKVNSPELTDKYSDYGRLTGYSGDALKAGSSEQRLAAALFAPLEWTIKRSSGTDVEVNIKTVDMEDAFNQFVADSVQLDRDNLTLPENERLTEEQMQPRYAELLIKIIGESTGRVETDVTIRLKETDGEYKVEMSGALRNALTGKLLEIGNGRG